MNTMTVRMAQKPLPISSYLYKVKLTADHLISALKLKTTKTSLGYTTLPDNKKANGYFPKVSGLQGISYSENERDRLFYG